MNATIRILLRLSGYGGTGLSFTFGALFGGSISYMRFTCPAVARQREGGRRQPNYSERTLFYSRSR
jgi:hypothetical protein